jgi:hypothetical protein
MTSNIGDVFNDEKLPSFTRAMLRKSEYLLNVANESKNSKRVSRKKIDSENRVNSTEKKYHISSDIKPYSARKAYIKTKEPLNDGSYERMKWMHQRVNEVEILKEPKDKNLDDLEKEVIAGSKSQWEHQIARHILSVYATTKAVENANEGKGWMVFVDKKRQETAETVSNFIQDDGNQIIEALQTIDRPKSGEYRNLKSQDSKRPKSKTKKTLRTALSLPTVLNSTMTNDHSKRSNKTAPSSSVQVTSDEEYNNDDVDLIGSDNEIQSKYYEQSDINAETKPDSPSSVFQTNLAVFSEEDESLHKGSELLDGE